MKIVCFFHGLILTVVEIILNILLINRFLHFSDSYYPVGGALGVSMKVFSLTCIIQHTMKTFDPLTGPPRHYITLEGAGRVVSKGDSGRL